MIKGEVVSRQYKADIAAEIAAALDLPAPPVSRGSSVDSLFLDRMFERLVGGSSGGPDAYRKVELLLEQLGLTYDPYWDTSESAPKGGSTVTARAFSRIRSAVTGVPRCFILNVNDADVGNRWEIDHNRVYRYDDSVSGRRAFTEAGPGSKIIYYATHKSRVNPKHFVATAEVEYIAPGWRGPWEARITEYSSFDFPVPVEEVDIPGWNRQISLTEISLETYQAFLRRGLLAATDVDVRARGTVRADPGGEQAAERVREDFPADAVLTTIKMPSSLPRSVPPSSEPTPPRYVEDGEDLKVTAGEDRPKSNNPRSDKLAELRAVELTVEALRNSGWSVERDRQSDGVGYDISFSDGVQTLHVEIKGIQGSRLAFNVTPKEYWRAENDERWVLVAVTSVLSPRDFQLHLITRDRIVAARRSITGYRLTL